MGCACGLSYGDGLENGAQRKKDVKGLMNFLLSNILNNKLKIFCIDYTEFKDIYEEREFNPTRLNETEFDFEELVIFNVVI